MPNIYRPEFEDGERPEGFKSRGARIGHGRPDVVVYPDAGKIGVGERLPKGGGLRAFFKRDDAVNYFEGEQFPPAADK